MTLEEAFRRHGAETLATLARLLGGDLDLAEESLQDAFAAAATAWARAPPASPRAWLVSVGRRRALDRIRRRYTARAGQAEIALEASLAQQAAIDDAGAEDEAGFGDDLLRLVFTCCHPALGLEARVALTLRTVCRLPTATVASAFLVSEETMAQRVVRAKAKIRAAAIPYRTPPRELLDERLEGVLAVIYLVFTEAYACDPGASLASEAIGLARRLDALLPGRGSVQGLLALMLLVEARRPAWYDDAGDLVLLERQNRALWNSEMITEGLPLVERALTAATPPSPYAVQAAIAALHDQAPRADATDWRQILALYAVLLRLAPTPVIELNHAVALAMVDGPEPALQRVEALAARGALARYGALEAVRADLLRRLGRCEEAGRAYAKAARLARNDPERRYLSGRMRELAQVKGPP